MINYLYNWKEPRRQNIFIEVEKQKTEKGIYNYLENFEEQTKQRFCIILRHNCKIGQTIVLIT